MVAGRVRCLHSAKAKVIARFDRVPSPKRDDHREVRTAHSYLDPVRQKCSIGMECRVRTRAERNRTCEAWLPFERWPAQHFLAEAGGGNAGGTNKSPPQKCHQAFVSR